MQEVFTAFLDCGIALPGEIVIRTVRGIFPKDFSAESMLSVSKDLEMTGKNPRDDLNRLNFLNNLNKFNPTE